MPGSDRDWKVHLILFWFNLNNLPRTPSVSFCHPGIENCAFPAPLGQKGVAFRFRVGKIRARKKSLVLFKSHFLRENSINFDNSFFPSSVYVQSTEYTNMSQTVYSIDGLGKILWVYRFLWCTRYPVSSLKMKSYPVSRSFYLAKY